jgi:hypothetical protein
MEQVNRSLLFGFDINLAPVYLRAKEATWAEYASECWAFIQQEGRQDDVDTMRESAKEEFTCVALEWGNFFSHEPKYDFDAFVKVIFPKLFLSEVR